jgi:hypothetical protein
VIFTKFYSSVSHYVLRLVSVDETTAGGFVC